MNNTLDKKEIEKAAAKISRAQPKGVSSALVSFLMSAIYPILPGLLIAAAPRILKSKKFLDILGKVDEVIDQIREQAAAE